MRILDFLTATADGKAGRRFKVIRAIPGDFGGNQPELGVNLLIDVPSKLTELLAGLNAVLHGERVKVNEIHFQERPSFLYSLGCCNSRRFKYRRGQAERQGGEGDEADV